MSEFLHIQEGSGIYSNVAQLKRYKTLQRFLIKKINKNWIISTPMHFYLVVNQIFQVLLLNNNLKY